MKRTNLTALATLFFGASLPAISNAAPPEKPVVSVGLLGSYSVMEFTGQRSTSKEYMPEGGLFLNFGNKMTARQGFVYQAEISGQYSERQGQRVKDAQADLDMGWRVALNESNSIDLLLGGGYKWNRLQPHSSKYDIELTSRTPFVKVAAGYNHYFSNTTVRFEAGIRRALQGDSKLDIENIYNENMDLLDTTNPFAELSVLFNRHGTIPVAASLYYNRFIYDLDGQYAVSDFDKQTRNEYGVKVGIAF
ncbi:hypothetical protein [Pseudomonas sp. BP8]|uniref:hypothetical protein n=1 Tax=Pseudomonas sp. BP8 TaxID=2817864 RepID=UPI001AE0F586|nr:hypothetical protein [Pseudomonas sp. BP8]MBP2261701.1 hypothetical protein [Pseudomonas sp. BP8]HDS1733822.1 hypothetical protein [Pseudomonas putida]